MKGGTTEATNHMTLICRPLWTCNNHDNNVRVNKAPVSQATEKILDLLFLWE